MSTRLLTLITIMIIVLVACDTGDTASDAPIGTKSTTGTGRL